MSGGTLEDKNGNVTRREKNPKKLTDRNTTPQSKHSEKKYRLKLQTQQQTLLMVEWKIKS